MANKEQMTEQIEAYLAEEMTPEERAAFEVQIRDDQTLAEEVKLHRQTHKLLELYTQVDYKEKLRRIDAAMEAAPEGKTIPLSGRKNIFSHPVFRAAAVILLLLASSWVLLFYRYDPDRIASEQFEPYRDVITYKGDVLPSDSLILAAMARYNMKDYADARQTLEKTLAQYPDLADARFYLAMSLLAEGEAAASIGHLQQLTSNSKYGEVSEWYLALAWLKAGDRDKAVAVLQKIANNPGHGYKEKAGALLQNLTSIWWSVPGVG
ncbi:MAG: tetratricopeptide repeat protein [Bacteroidia bacterium]